MPEVSAELRERFRSHAEDPGHVEAVIVTLEPGADAGRLEREGMQVDRRIKSLPIVSGRLDASTLEALSRLDGIERIELDAEGMHTLGN
jgi:hypothetical protein